MIRQQGWVALGISKCCLGKMTKSHGLDRAKHKVPTPTDLFPDPSLETLQLMRKPNPPAFRISESSNATISGVKSPAQTFERETSHHFPGKVWDTAMVDEVRFSPLFL
jgi:hypothetical protein